MKCTSLIKYLLTLRMLNSFNILVVSQHWSASLAIKLLDSGWLVVGIPQNGPLVWFLVEFVSILSVSPVLPSDFSGTGVGIIIL